MIRSVAAGAAVLCLLSACASAGGAEGASAPDLTPVPAQPLSANGYLVIACVHQAIEGARFEMIGDDGESRLIRFICTGGPAQMMFDALAMRSADIGSEWSDGDVVVRSTEKVQRNLYGLDLCSREGAAHRCEVNLNIGGFLVE